MRLRGDITGAVLAGVPYLYRDRLSARLVLDLRGTRSDACVLVGRTGELIIG